jgi:tetratricopeptide (TPR) repeat protein
MKAHRTTLVSLLAVLLLAGISSGQVSVASVPQQLRQAEPPPASASAAQLEATGDDLHARKYFADALDYYQAANNKEPSARLLNKVGMMNLLLMRVDAARKDFEHALKLDPKYADAYNNLGAVEYQDHRLKPAIKRYQQAIELNPAFATYHSNLGTAYMERKEFDKAASEYARALQIDPDVFEHRGSAGISARFPSPSDRARFHYVIAKTYARAGNTDRCLLYLTKAMEFGFKDIDRVYKEDEFAAVRKDPRFAQLMAKKQTLMQP